MECYKKSPQDTKSIKGTHQNFHNTPRFPHLFQPPESICIPIRILRLSPNQKTQTKRNRTNWPTSSSYSSTARIEPETHRREKFCKVRSRNRQENSPTETDGKKTPQFLPQLTVHPPESISKPILREETVTGSTPLPQIKKRRGLLGLLFSPISFPKIFPFIGRGEMRWDKTRM